MKTISIYDTNPILIEQCISHCYAYPSYIPFICPLSLKKREKKGFIHQRRKNEVNCISHLPKLFLIIYFFLRKPRENCSDWHFGMRNSVFDKKYEY